MTGAALLTTKRICAKCNDLNVALKESGMQEKELLLIGTVHRDPDGAAKLRKLLAEKRPVAVAIEVSPYGLFYRRRNGRRLLRRLMKTVKRLAEDLQVSWQSWGQIHAIRAQIQLPFEYRTALSYCRDTGAALSCIDSSTWSKRWIDDHWCHLLSRENLEILLAECPQDQKQEVGRGYRMAALLLRSREEPFISAVAQSWSADLHWQQRENDLAQTLEELYATVAKGRLVYVGGWQHMLGPNAGGTLYERLEHLQPRRVLLDGGGSMGRRETTRRRGETARRRLEVSSQTTGDRRQKFLCGSGF
jgi:hypothetical protein